MLDVIFNIYLEISAKQLLQLFDRKLQMEFLWHSLIGHKLLQENIFKD